MKHIFYKTVDEMIIHHCTHINNKGCSEQEICNYIVIYSSYTLLDVLNLKTNTPSRFDFLIIKSISNVIHTEPLLAYKMILEHYTNRDQK